MALSDFERGVVTGKLVASQAFTKALGELTETLGISARLRDVRARFLSSESSCQRTIEDDDIAREQEGLPPYVNAVS